MLLFLKKLAHYLFELIDIDRLAEDAAPGALMRHHEPLQAKEWGEFRRPNPRPIGQ